ncbi:AAEL002797-PA [Aedes aegypti]|uniref:Mitochondrial NADH-ubiquinone oxidoreductase 9 kDa subunit-like protein n=2 Tax=Aedes aegypti TaxID=7159 RepID=Q1HQW7_AEDAE|nr:uncharacterized protein LOC5576103 [Aedes aegypti]ABF18360.1 mitochondrial NADH-ubiquinone oxidoreductase 9 kDa subunit-like protein [Aedes aegypti]EAT45958.1 AAEL002797-PA [Aedes aegypti]
MIRQILLKNDILVRLVAARAYSQTPTGSKPAAASQAAAPKPVSADVPGLSSKCVHSKTGPIGPGASRDGEYKVPEYYCYDKNSYFEAEIEMNKFRLPQPSSKQ